MHQNGPLLHIIAFNSTNYLHNQFLISKYFLGAVWSLLYKLVKRVLLEIFSTPVWVYEIAICFLKGPVYKMGFENPFPKSH